MTIKTKIARPISSIAPYSSFANAIDGCRAQLSTHEFQNVLHHGLHAAIKCNASSEDLNALLDMVWSENVVIVEGHPMCVQVEVLSVNRELRLPAYNYKGPGSVMTLGHLWPHRHLTVNSNVGEIVHKAVMAAVADIKDAKCAERMIDAYLRFLCKKEALETTRFDGPWDDLVE